MNLHLLSPDSTQSVEAFVDHYKDTLNQQGNTISILLFAVVVHNTKSTSKLCVD